MPPYRQMHLESDLENLRTSASGHREEVVRRTLLSQTTRDWDTIESTAVRSRPTGNRGAEPAGRGGRGGEPGPCPRTVGRAGGPEQNLSTWLHSGALRLAFPTLRGELSVRHAPRTARRECVEAPCSVPSVWLRLSWGSAQREDRRPSGHSTHTGRGQNQAHY